MKSEVASRKKSGSVLLSLLPLVVLGGAFGYLLAGDVSTASVRHIDLLASASAWSGRSSSCSGWISWSNSSP